MISVDGLGPADYERADAARLTRLPQHDLLVMAGARFGDLAPWRNPEYLRAVAALPEEQALANLFVLGRQVPEGSLPAPLLALLSHAKIVSVGSGLLSADYPLVRLEGLTVLAAWRAAGRETGSYAPWVGTDTSTLCRLVAARRTARTALDLGCGTGALAMTAARNGARALAVDINPECLAATTFNAALNGLADRVAVRQADMAALDLGERFDLVVSNPPFLPMRRGALGWLAGEGGPDGLDFVWAIVRQLPELLTERGEALVQFASFGDEHGPFCAAQLAEELPGLGLSARMLLKPPTPPRWPAFAERDEQGNLAGELGGEYRAFVESIGATHYHPCVLSLRPGGGGLTVGRYS
ncbi:methyltransferase [Crossiella sp. NPDC003009]